jgi:hypothetical protein
MIDVYAQARMFIDTHRLAVDLATAVKTIEQVPNIPMFLKNTAAFVHELSADALGITLDPHIPAKQTNRLKTY